MSHDAPPPPPDTAIDALFAVPLAEFTPARNALAAAMKKAGDKAGAEAVKALAKPSATAWAVNQVWWRQREVLVRVIEAGAAQRAAHVAWSHGKKADLRESAQARDAAVRAAIDAAAAALSPGKPAAADAQYRISGTIQALASSGWPAGQRPGCLAHDLQSSGLEALGALADSVGPGPTRVPRGQAKPAVAPERAEPPQEAAPASDARRRREAAAKARVAELEALHADTADAARATRAAAETARVEADAAAARRATLEAQLDEARQAESAARRQLAQATAAAGEAEMKHARTSRELTAAREALR